jgi:hypothetical protein
MSETPNPPAGWYPDPTTGEQRYWDGQAWAAQTPPPQPLPSPYDAPTTYSNPQHPAPPPYAAAQQATGNTLSIIGIVLGCIAVVFCPPGFGIAGIVLGIIGNSKGERLGKVAIIVSAVGLVLGLVLGAIVFTSMRDS